MSFKISVVSDGKKGRIADMNLKNIQIKSRDIDQMISQTYKYTEL